VGNFDWNQIYASKVFADEITLGVLTIFQMRGARPFGRTAGLICGEKGGNFH